MISCYIELPDNQRDWDKKLKFLTFAYNSAQHSTTGFSPFEALFGREQKIPSDLFDEEIIVELPINNIEYVQQLKSNLSNVYKLIKHNRSFKMNKAKIRYDRTTTGCNFKKGDKVWKLIETRKKGITASIAAKQDGPYSIIEVLNNGQNYIIKQDNKRGRPKTVNRCKLRICRTRPDINNTNPTPIIVIPDDEASSKPEPAQLINSNLNTNNTSPKKRGRPRKQNINNTPKTSNSSITITPITSTNNPKTSKPDSSINITQQSKTIGKYQLRNNQQITFPK
jgi:hypothetical protein